MRTRAPKPVRRSRRRAPRFGAALFVIAAAAALAPGSPLYADEEPEAAPSTLVEASDAETEAYALLAQGKLITARTRAEQALADDPDAIIGNLVLGLVLYEAEGLLPKAMVHLSRARRVFERAYGEVPEGEGKQGFHQLLLRAIQGISGEMEQFDEQLRVIDRFDALYEPKLFGERAWALLQLRRFDEAKAAAILGSGSDDPWERSVSQNALCGIESELKTRQAQYKACLASLAATHGDALGGEITPGLPSGPGVSLSVDAVNAASAAHSVLRFDEVERLALLATKTKDDSIANPWRTLCALYTDEGRLAEAVTAAREMQRWRLRLSANLRDQDRAETFAVLAALLLAFGEVDAGHRVIARAIERPDRRGLVSSKFESVAAGFALLRRSFNKVKRELAAERASAGGIGELAKGALSAAKSLAAGSVDDARIAGVLADEALLRATLRMYLSGIDAPSWLVGDLVDVLGAGVVGAELALVRADEAAAAEGVDLSGYYDALEAEVALARGDEAEAAALAASALARIPQAEALLKARVAAVGAEALALSGDHAGAVASFQRAFEADPGVFRRLGIAIPAAVEAPVIDPVASLVASRIAGSPRFYEDRAGFVVFIDRPVAAYRACLRAPDGASLACAEVAGAPGELDADLAARVVTAFHRAAFAPRVSLTSGDLRSLDGATTLAGQAERERMEEILRSMAEDPARGR